MGMCKCKKRTELFCFVHKKAVCEQCICTEHQVCVVKTYVEWLTDPEYETPSCGICKGELVEGSMVRLLCLDMFHPECIDVYANSLPSNTAQAGYVCPTCSKPMLPSATNTSPIADNIRAAFANSKWAPQMLPSREGGNSPPTSHQDSLNHSSSTHNHITEPSLDPDASPSPTPAFLATQSTSNSASINKDISNSYYTQASTSPSSTAVTINPPYSLEKPSTTSSPALYGVASRKPQPKSATSYPVDEEDEDKYKRKGLMQLFLALGLLTKPTGADTKKGLKLDPKRLLLVFALIASFATVVVLYMLVLDSEEGLKTTIEEQPPFVE